MRATGDWSKEERRGAVVESGGNRLLDLLTPQDRALLAPLLERVPLLVGRTLFDAGEDVTHAHFPLHGTVVSLLSVTTDGRAAECATVGSEGVIGGLISAGNKPAFGRSVVQVAGAALRIESEQLEDAKNASATLRDALARYADALLAQVLQSVACNALHPVEARACRWLMTVQDRVGSDELPVTQEFLAEMLGVRRTTVTRVVAALEGHGAVRHRRGHILVADRGRLEACACECYGMVRDHYRRVAPGLHPEPPARR